MDSEQFKEFGHEAINYMANYVENIRDRKVLPDVEPGYLDSKIPDEVPETGEHWKTIMDDFDKLIMPGMTHWQSPQFHAFYPTGSSYPSMIGELISAGLGVIGFHWTSSPACTELEVKMMNWLGKLLNLPPQFLNCHHGPGGGVIQCSASDATLLCLLAAQAKSIRRLQKLHPEMSEGEIRAKLRAYTSDHSNSSVEKAGIIGGMQMRILKCDGPLPPETLLKAIKKDIDDGLFPCYVIATIGTTGICADDDLTALGPLCRENNAWLHVDAAYAGSALILPEYQYLLKGMEYVESFSFNPHKWLMVNFDCSALWSLANKLGKTGVNCAQFGNENESRVFKILGDKEVVDEIGMSVGAGGYHFCAVVQNAGDLVDPFIVDRLYLKDHENLNTQLPEYRHWQIPLGRRFRALKLWFVLKAYGKEGLRAHLRNHIRLAESFASLVENDSRFELIFPPKLGLVCFRLKGDNTLTERLHSRLMSRRNLYMITATVDTKLILRFVVCSRQMTDEDVRFAWNEITSQAEEVLKENQVPNGH